MDGDASSIPLSDAHGDSTSTKSVRMNGLMSRHLQWSSHDVRGVARVNELSKEFELRNTSPGVVQDISSRIEHVMVSDKSGDTPVPTSM